MARSFRDSFKRGRVLPYERAVRNTFNKISKPECKGLSHGVGAILVIAHQKAARSRAKTSFAPTRCLRQCPNIVKSDLADPHLTFARGFSFTSSWRYTRVTHA